MVILEVGIANVCRFI